MRRIKSNKARCTHCGDIIESTAIDEIVTCSCGKVSVKGGHAFIRREFWMRNDYEELSEYEDIECDKELEKRVSDIHLGKSVLKEHELIEED